MAGSPGGCVESRGLTPKLSLTEFRCLYPTLPRVFECWLGEKGLAQVREKVAPYVTAEFDSVRFYGLCETGVGRVEVIGWGDRPKQEQTWVV